MIDPIHLLSYIIRPALKELDLHSEAAERLLLGTACAESDCGRWLRQVGEGPALGIFQMEPATHLDCWVNFLQYRPDLAKKIVRFTRYIWPECPEPREMIGNLVYATAMARVKYLRDPAPIPGTLEEQAVYWKSVYNTEQGAGTVEKYIRKWRQFVPANVA